MSNRGLFITFEGPDGGGKSTQWRLLADRLRWEGYDVLAVREPGGTAIGDQIRAVLHDPANKAMQPHAEVLLYSASRAQLVRELIRPHLECGGIVLSDRYADSTIAYQGYGHCLDLEMLRAITSFATGDLKPDLTIYLDLDVGEGLRRRQVASQAGKGEWNRMDQQALDFHRRVRAGYLEMIAAEPGRWWVIDALQPAEVLQELIYARVKEVIGDTLKREESGHHETGDEHRP
jgi:dTMP kinase